MKAIKSSPGLQAVFPVLILLLAAFYCSGVDSTREIFNSGSAQLRNGKLREAETLLESVLETQKDGWRVPALYNLGHSRFAQGMEELKKTEAAGPAAARGRAIAMDGEEAITEGRDALKANEIRRMVNAYMHGRGTRRELRAAIRTVRQALEVYAASLNRLERASGDWKSAVELDPKNADARHNAEVADRHIARIIDSVRDLQQSLQTLQNAGEELQQMMSQLKGRIPEKDMPPGASGDDEQEEESEQGDGTLPPPGTREEVGTEGVERRISPEEAGWMLEGFRSGEDRRLPMSQGVDDRPKDNNRPTW